MATQSGLLSLLVASPLVRSKVHWWIWWIAFYSQNKIHTMLNDHMGGIICNHIHTYLDLADGGTDFLLFVNLTVWRCIVWFVCHKYQINNVTLTRLYRIFILRLKILIDSCLCRARISEDFRSEQPCQLILPNYWEVLARSDAVVSPVAGSLSKTPDRLMYGTPSLTAIISITHPTPRACPLRWHFSQREKSQTTPNSPEAAALPYQHSFQGEHTRIRRAGESNLFGRLVLYFSQYYYASFPLPITNVTPFHHKRKWVTN